MLEERCQDADLETLEASDRIGTRSVPTQMASDQAPRAIVISSAVSVIAFTHSPSSIIGPGQL